MFRKWFIVVFAILLTCSTVVRAAPYYNYTYNHDGNPSAEPQAYIPTQVITGASLGVGEFDSPSDVHVSSAGDIYVSDTGNNRIVVLGSDYTYKRTIDTFDNRGTPDGFHAQTGLYTGENGELYVADTGNKRIVELDAQDKLVRVIGVPDTGSLAFDYEYQPIKVAVDFAGRLFIVSKNCNQGVIQLDADGSFLGYFGAVKTQATPFEILWRSLASERQQEFMSLILPTEYSSIDIDRDGFVYGTVSAIDTSKSYSTTMFLRKLNPMGVDVLKRNGNFDPRGDVYCSTDPETGRENISRFCDVVVQECGIYAALDSYAGRIFTYDDNGELLYIFGALGSERGQFGNPCALTVTAEQEFIVLDNKYQQLVCFEPTEYGRIITQAEQASFERQYEQSEKLWFEALKYTARSELVFQKIGNCYINQGDYETAMRYLEYADSRSGYSEALGYYRSQVLAQYFGPVMTGVCIVIVVLVIWRVLRRRRRKGASS